MGGWFFVSMGLVELLKSDDVHSVGKDLLSRSAFKGEHGLFDDELQVYLGLSKLPNSMRKYIGGWVEKLYRRIERSTETVARLTPLVIRDPLTGLFNRRKYEHDLENAIHSVDRTAAAESKGKSVAKPYDVTLLMIDIDYFKRVNDTYGHLKGDEVLKTVANVINGALRKHEQDGVHRVGDKDPLTSSVRMEGVERAHRYGGEEIAVILPSTDSHQGYQIAERIRAAIEEGCNENATQVEGGITASIGLSNYLGLCSTKEELQRFTDSALYEAKATGRNNVVMRGRNGFKYGPNGIQKHTRPRWKQMVEYVAKQLTRISR